MANTIHALGAARPRDVAISKDGATVYASFADGYVRAYDAGSGALVGEWDVGTTLGAMDLSPDGTFLIVAEAEPLTSYYAPDTSDNQFTVATYRLALGSGEVTTYLHTARGYEYAFFDVAVLSNNKVLVTERALPGWSATLYPLELDLGTGQYEVVEDRRVTTNTWLSPSEDGRWVFMAEGNSSDPKLDMYRTPLGFAAWRHNYQDDVTGYNDGFQAYSGEAGLAVQVVGRRILILDNALRLQRDLTQTYTQWQDYGIYGAAFNAGGTRLFLLDNEAQSIAILSTSDWSLLGTIPIDGLPVISGRGDYGNRLMVAPGENYITVVTDSGLYAVANPNPTNVVLTGTGAAEVLTGTPFDDSIAALGGNDWVLGGLGADSIDGGDGDDVLAGGADGDLVHGGSGRDLLYGGDGNDRLDGGGGDDELQGGRGFDRFDGGSDNMAADPASYGDRISFYDRTATRGANADLRTGTVWDDGFGNQQETFTGIESFGGGTAFADTFIGGDGRNSIVLARGDYGHGFGGPDLFVLEAAPAQIYGGDEMSDWIELRSGGMWLIPDGDGDGLADLAPAMTSGWTIDLLNHSITDGYGNTGSVIMVPNVRGSVFDDMITGDLWKNILDGGAGADRMTGGVHDDIYYVDNAGDVVVELDDEESAMEGRADEVRTALASYVLAANVEKLTATSDSAHDFRGNGDDNVVTGGGGADLLRLHDGGDDTVLAGAGNDNIFFIGSLTAADVVNGGEGTDTLVLQGPYGSLTLTANVTQIENISILGGNNTVFGEPGTNRHDYVLTTVDSNFAAGIQARINGAALLAGEDFTFDGSAETDALFVVYGGKGRDTLTGGQGNDIFFYAEERFASGDTVNGGAGYDGMFLRGNYTIDFNAPGYTGLFTNIENLTLTSATDERYARGGGTEFDYNLTLSDAIVNPGYQLTVSGAVLTASETMVFDASAETDGTLRLFGGRASDTLKGGALNDLIHGNLGADTLAGNGGADAFRYQNVAESSSGSMDHILDFTPGTDKIELDRVDANALVAGNQAFSWIGSSAFTGSAGQLRAYEQGGTWFVEGDVNGDGGADLVIALTLQGPTPLGAGDFLL
ncbi:MAG TPA: calcium-binding protein [Allosphingosinicella sp.]